MKKIQKLCRIEETLVQDIKAISNELHQSENQTIESALKLYRDYHHMQNKATFINEQILNVFRACVDELQRNINQMSNQLISELAIQAAILNQIISGSLEVDQKELHRYRLRALDFLRENQRIFRMEEQ